MSPIGPEHELPQARGGEESDAYTVAFGDPGARLYGVARDGAFGIVFAGTEVARVATDGVAVEVLEPLQRWTARFEGGFELELEALAPPAEVSLAGMKGYEQLCRVTGTVTAGGEERRVECLGQRGHAWGRADWSKLELTRTVTAWIDEGTAVTLSAVRDASAKHHADEDVAAHVVLGGTPVAVSDPRLSTRYDAVGRQVHAGLELWVGDGEDEYPHRAAGEVLCGTTLDLGSLRLDCAFFEWRMNGRTGVGRYDVARRA